MPITTGISSKGGAKMKAVLAAAEKNRASRIKVGFIGGQHENGASIPVIAAVLNYGSPAQGIPERQYFGQAVSILREDLPRLLAKTIDPSTLTVSQREGRVVGRWAVGVLRQRIADLKEPPNSPATLAAKQGSNPLLDSGKLSDAVSYELL